MPRDATPPALLTRTSTVPSTSAVAPLDLLGAAEVGRLPGHLPRARRAKLFSGRLQLAGPPPDNDDVITGRNEPGRDRLAYPRAAARYHCNTNHRELTSYPPYSDAI